MVSIITYPDKRLTRIPPLCESPVPQEVLDDLLAGVKENNALGLAAPQIGYNYRVILVLGRFMVNPVICYYMGLSVAYKECCLSIPGEEFTILQNTIVLVRYQSTDLKTLYEQEYRGHVSGVIQHEVDHLHGVLING